MSNKKSKNNKQKNQQKNRRTRQKKNRRGPQQAKVALSRSCQQYVGTLVDPFRKVNDRELCMPDGNGRRRCGKRFYRKGVITVGSGARGFILIKPGHITLDTTEYPITTTDSTPYAGTAFDADHATAGVAGATYSNAEPAAQYNVSSLLVRPYLVAIRVCWSGTADAVNGTYIAYGDSDLPLDDTTVSTVQAYAECRQEQVTMRAFTQTWKLGRGYYNDFKNPADWSSEGTCGIGIFGTSGDTFQYEVVEYCEMVGSYPELHYTMRTHQDDVGQDLIDKAVPETVPKGLTVKKVFDGIVAGVNGVTRVVGAVAGAALKLAPIIGALL